MPIPSAYHAKLAPLCTSMFWKEWAGYHAIKSFDTCHEREYFAFRHAAGVIDVSPLYKYEVHGPDAGALLARIMVKDVRKLKVGQVTYLCWCDDHGYVVDDGTVTKIADDYFRVTAAEPTLHWLKRYSRGYRVSIEDSSERFAALAIQGPHSRDILKACSDIDMDALKFFRMDQGELGGAPVSISRTGYTGDLGYEIWSEKDKAGEIFDTLMTVGAPWSIKPCGLDALDVTRIEAGFIMNGVDYYSANHCMIDARKSTPYELNLGWCVQTDREPFIGQAALKKEKKTGPKKKLVGLDISWPDLEAQFAAYDLPPEVPHGACRDGKPIYNLNSDFIGQATSTTWSPVLKKYLALATVDADFAVEGRTVQFEITVEYERKLIPAKIVKTPFYNPERKRA